MLNTRMSEILRELMKAETAITSEYLAKVLDVTSRTIRNDIKELESIVSNYGAIIHSIRGTGYHLEITDDHLFRQLLKEISAKDKEKAGELPTLPEERVHYILKRLLLADDYIKIDDVADELFVSKSTLQNDLRDAKKILASYGITLDKRPNFGLKCKGTEFKMRLYMADNIFNKTEVIMDDTEIATQEEISMIRGIIVEQVKKHDITLSDIGLNNLIIHVVIAFKRIQNHKYVTILTNELKDLKSQKQYQVAQEIVAHLEKSLHVQFPETEVAYITIHLLGTKMVTELHLNESEIQGIVDRQIFEIAEKIIDKIDSELHLSIKEDQELFIAMCLHLKPAIHRFRYGINLPNPLIDDIKVNYPVAFQAAIIAGTVLKQELDININENEIGYLALHVGAAMENLKIGNQPKRCMIVCASGVGSARLLASKLRANFGSRIEIAGTTEYYKLSQIPMNSIDFLISTIPVAEDLPVPVIQVNTILGGNDLNKIESLLTGRNHQKLKYTREELIFLQKGFENREEVLIFLGEELKSMGLVNDKFLDFVYEREALSPTSYGNLVAIPHPVTPQTDTSFWTFCTLKNPIDWGGKKVQFICLLNVEKNSSDDLQNMYDLLLKIIDNSHIIQQLIKCDTYKQFETILLQCFRD
jgi:lichenan operon transcriptional antiterminator